MPTGAKKLRVNHAQRHLSNISALLGDAATCDVKFVVPARAYGRGTTVISGNTGDTGPGNATQAPAVVLEADFSEESDARHNASVVHRYAGAVRADVGEDQSTQVELVEVRAHRAILAACSDWFRDRLYRPSSLGGDGRGFSLDATVELPEGVTARALEVVREYAYTGQCHVDSDNSVEVMATCELCGVVDLAEVIEPFITDTLTEANVFTVLYGAFIYAERHADDECRSAARRVVEAGSAFFCKEAHTLVQVRSPSC
jgi:hypothetical protein